LALLGERWGPFFVWGYSLSHAYRSLAVAVLNSAVDALKVRRPRRADARRQWSAQRQDTVEFFEHPRASAVWCEAAGMEWDTVVSRLRMQGLLAALLLASGCDATITTRVICRGDSSPAVGDTALVRCSTLDTLARR
jgi:hypothetical protein